VRLILDFLSAICDSRSQCGEGLITRDKFAGLRLFGAAAQFRFERFEVSSALLLRVIHSLILPV